MLDKCRASNIFGGTVMIIVMGEFRLNPESIEILRNEIAEVIKKSNQESFWNNHDTVLHNANVVL